MQVVLKDTVGRVLPVVLACWLDCWHSFCLGLTEKIGKRYRLYVGTGNPVSKPTHRECIPSELRYQGRFSKQHRLAC